MKIGMGSPSPSGPLTNSLGLLRTYYPCNRSTRSPAGPRLPSGGPLHTRRALHPHSPLSASRRRAEAVCVPSSPPVRAFACTSDILGRGGAWPRRLITWRVTVCGLCCWGVGGCILSECCGHLRSHLAGAICVAESFLPLVSSHSMGQEATRRSSGPRLSSAGRSTCFPLGVTKATHDTSNLSGHRMDRPAVVGAVRADVDWPCG